MSQHRSEDATHPPVWPIAWPTCWVGRGGLDTTTLFPPTWAPRRLADGSGTAMFEWEHKGTLAQVTVPALCFKAKLRIMVLSNPESYIYKNVRYHFIFQYIHQRKSLGLYGPVEIAVFSVPCKLTKLLYVYQNKYWKTWLVYINRKSTLVAVALYCQIRK